VVGIVVATGWAWGMGSLAGPAHVPPAAPPAVDWKQVLLRLDGARAQAFARSAPAVLARVYVARSPLLQADEQALAGLAAVRRTAIGVRHVVHALQVLAVTPDRVELRVRESLAAYVVRGPSASARHPEGSVVEHVVVLVRTVAGWRVGEMHLIA
jgi:hypothetical protein